MAVYRRLSEMNSCSVIARWPLPNIANMLRRIGSRNPVFFAKFDMTSGYHQFPLEESSTKYTAFCTFMGNYEWTRIVMGLSGAGSNFQQRMSTEILAGLLYFNIEVYLDDILVHATTEQELLITLRKLLARFRQFHVFLILRKSKSVSNNLSLSDT